MAESHPRQGVASEHNDSDGEKSTECRYCDREFESYAARRRHEGHSHTLEYQDEETLRHLYHGEELSMAEIADKFDTNSSRIEYWIEEFDIETRDPNEHQERTDVRYRIDSRGYMKWSTYVSENNKHVQEHRLLAVAEYGFDAVAGKVVHHKNNISWDNRADNIELMTASEHAKHHYSESHPVNK